MSIKIDWKKCAIKTTKYVLIGGAAVAIGAAAGYLADQITSSKETSDESTSETNSNGEA